MWIFTNTGFVSAVFKYGAVQEYCCTTHEWLEVGATIPVGGQIIRNDLSDMSLSACPFQ